MVGREGEEEREKLRSTGVEAFVATLFFSYGRAPPARSSRMGAAPYCVGLRAP
jgi:hypothetical protein